MKKVYSFFEKYSFVLLLLFLLITIFRPLIQYREIPFSSNLLVSFFNPWAVEKFPGWEQGIPNKPVGIDDIRIFYPQRHFTVSQYRKGILPLWNPYNFSGNYHAGLSETAIFYPLSFLFLFLPQLPTWIVLLLFEPVAITIGMYLFLKELRLSKVAAIFGSITFGFSGLVIVRMVEGFSVGHTLLWTPFVLYGIEAFFQKKKVRFLLITLIALSMSLLAGWFQFAFYTIFLGGIYAAFRWITESHKKHNCMVFLPFLLLPLVTLFHIVPALESFALSSRGATTTQELLNLHLMPWSHLLTYIFPDFFGNPGSYNFFGKSEYKESIVYIGVIPFMLSLFGLSLWKKNKYILFFSILSTVGVFLGIDTPVTRSILSLPIPIVSSFLPNRVFYFATIGLSILSAYGLEVILAKKLDKLQALFAGLIAEVLLGVANGFVFFSTIPTLSQRPLFSRFSFLGNLHLIGQAYQIDIAKHNLYLSDIFVVGLVVCLIIGRFISKKTMVVGLFILMMVGQIYFAQKYIPFSQVQFVFPSHDVFTYLQSNAEINRFISTGNGYITTNSPLIYNLYSPDGVGSMYISRYGQLVTYMQTRGKDAIHIPRIEIRIAPSADEALGGTNSYLLRFMQIDGIKYIVRLKSDPASLDEKMFTKVWENNKWEIYTYNKVLPRIFWTSNFVIEHTDSNNLASVFAGHDTSIVIEKNPGFISNNKNESAAIEEYTSNQIMLRTNASSSGLVYVSDNYVPQWKAYVDGKKVPVLRANYSFMAIPVTSGDHTVVLRYTDTKETIAFVIAGVSIGIVVISLLYFRKKKYL